MYAKNIYLFFSTRFCLTIYIYCTNLNILNIFFLNTTLCLSVDFKIGRFAVNSSF